MTKSETALKPRLSVYKRAAQPPPMGLTPRDREILHLVHDFRRMTRAQIERVLFPPGVSSKGPGHPTRTTIARHRLKLLFQHGYLDRWRVLKEEGPFATQPVYRLGEDGKALLAAERGEEGEKKREKEIGPLFVNHHLAINDFRIAVRLAAEAQGYRVIEWIDETTFKSPEWKDYVTVKGDRGAASRVPILPDGRFVLEVPGRGVAHFFLEVDRATESQVGKWTPKILAYLEYVRSKQYEQRYHTRSLRVLTVTTSRDRLIHLKKTTEDAGGDNLFWFTTRREVTPETLFSSPIWSVATGNALSPLIAPAP